VIEVQEFRAEVRDWLADNLVGEFAALKGLGGPGREDEAFEERLAWNKHLAAAGMTCLGWPEEHGGRGLSVAHRVAFYEEYAKADAPDKVNHFGEELLGPTVIAYGTPEQQQRFLPKILDVTLSIRSPSVEPKLDGCGMAVVNPPYVLHEELSEILPVLARLRGEDKGATWSLDRLTAEAA